MVLLSYERPVRKRVVGARNAMNDYDNEKLWSKLCGCSHIRGCPLRSLCFESFRVVDCV